jgi:2-polyprenyl-3-methyl-5-hydroxy-6-metoxy-1,4-benzoquinol methylase
MKIGVIPENLLERIVMALGIVPTPVLDSFSMLSARSLMVATKLDIFEALRSKPLTAREIAERCGINPDATRKLLNFLAPMGYLRLKEGRYALSPLSHKWLLKGGSRSLRDVVVMRFMEWDWIEHLEEMVRTGKPVDIHRQMSKEEWALYQRGMRSSVAVFGAEAIKRTPVPKGARDMLDVGGSHGYYSVALCRRHPGLRSVVLDLPEAVAQAAPILAQEGMGDRVVHWAGNALTDDLGSEAFDLVFVSNLVHHFDEAANCDLVRRIARALRPGGYCVIQDVVRQESEDAGGSIGASAALYFALTSEAGAWSFEEMANWQRSAGLMPQKPIRLRTLPGTGQQLGIKPTK